jgi:hypothetical protein
MKVIYRYLPVKNDFAIGVPKKVFYRANFSEIAAKRLQSNTALR